MTGHKLKYVRFFGREVPIVLQNENGPCPMLAIANVLLLRDAIRLPANTYEVEQERLMAILAEYLLDNNPIETTSSYAANLQQNLQDVIANMHKLTTGIDVNPKFSSVRGFEFTNETAIFDLFDIGLVHGWIIDPEEEVASAVGDMSYNQIVAKLVSSLGAASFLRLPSIPKEGPSLKDVDNTASITNINNPRIQCQLSVEDGHVRIKLVEMPVEEKKEISKMTEIDAVEVKKWTAVRDWLQHNSSQLSTLGLFQLYQQLPERELGVFFRNNHFNTIFKNNKSLYILVTDQGYIAESDLVWEKLESVNNDNQFCTGHFEPFKGASEKYVPDVDQDLQAALAASLTTQNNDIPPAILPSDFLSTNPQPAPQHDYHDADMALALQLQEEENMRQTQQTQWTNEPTSRRQVPPQPAGYVPMAGQPAIPAQGQYMFPMSARSRRRQARPVPATEMSVSHGGQSQPPDTMWARFKKWFV